MPKEILFHCSEVNHGPEWIAKRRPPLTRSEKEPDTPRLCACPTIAPCFAATLLRGDVFVYRTAQPTGSVKPRDVWDAGLTGERWLIPPVRMVFDRMIPAAITKQINGWVLAYLYSGHNGVPPKIRVCQWAIAAKLIDAPRREKQWAARVLEGVGITDPELYILEQCEPNWETIPG